jgi:hypothetical protein
MCGFTAAFAGVYVIWQLPSKSSVQEPVKLPAPAVEKLTVPEGVDAPVPAVSVTVAVQVDPCPAVTGVPQLTAVLVERFVTPSPNVPLLVL